MGCGVGLPSVRDRAAREREDGGRGSATGSTRGDGGFAGV